LQAPCRQQRYGPPLDMFFQVPSVMNKPAYVSLSSQQRIHQAIYNSPVVWRPSMGPNLMSFVFIVEILP
jgi:hypothetical protein